MTKGLILALAASAVLAGCGGGGSSSLPPTGGGGHTNATLAAGFAQTSGSQVTATHRNMLYRRLTTTLSGALEPFAIFFVPDSYVPSNAFPTIGYRAVAYLTGTAPSPLPTVTFTQTGPALQFLGADSNFSDATVPTGDTTVGIENVGAPSTVGQSTVTATAASLGQSVNILADTYAGTEISSSSGSTLNGPTGLTFSASGAEVTPSGQTPDLSISVGSPSAFVAPGGIVEVDESLDQVASSSYSGAPATTLPVSSVCSPNGNPISFIFKAQSSGLLVKIGEASLLGINNNPTPCTWTDMAVTYSVANSSGVFAY